ncbi:MAG: metal ABC transporter permease [Chthonomonadales bacterium]
MGLEYPFMQRALMVSLLMGTLCPLLGVFVVIRRMSFFGDAIAHSAFTGIALGLLLGVDPSLSSVAFAVLIALGMGALQARSSIPSDTIIGVFFAGAAALGILLIGLLQGYRTNLFAYLFGDVLTVSRGDLAAAAILLGGVAIAVLILRRPLLQVALNRDLAAVHGARVAAVEYALMVLLAVTVAMSIKLVGIILVTALLIIPAAAARNVSRSIRQVFAFALAAGVISAVLGLLASYQLNTASGPTIVMVSIVLFIASLIGAER